MKIQNSTFSLVTHLSCSSCNKEYNFDEIQSYAICCEKPLLVNYDLENPISKDILMDREFNMWRYHELLPVLNTEHIVSLGEGMTPIIRLKKLEEEYGYKNLLLKDEGLNPTGSFKSRGLSMAISKAKELGVKECVIPTAGNAGAAMSAYCAKAGISATVIMPKITPKIFQQEYRFYGAEVILVDGLIDKCGEIAKEYEKRTGAFNMSTLKEPYRIEGKKTMGFEIAEQMKWSLPDVIIYPTGGGTGLIGIWKAFKEMIQLKWISKEQLPKMIVVQSENCAPMVNYINGVEYDNSSLKESIANGLAVPKAFGKDLIMKVVEDSCGCAISISEDKILAGTLEIGRKEGIGVAPEGGAIWESLKILSSNGTISKQDQVLLLNTGSSLTYLDNLNLI